MSDAAAIKAAVETLFPEVSAERLMEYTGTIAQWERLSGSDDERRAFDYVEETLRGFGFETVRYNPLCYVSLPIAASLTIDGSPTDGRTITHSFSTSTGPAGVNGELVYVGRGTDTDYAGKDVRGKIAVTDGLAGPAKVGPAERAGVIGMINVNTFEVHDMIVSPVWGNPNPQNIDDLPTIPHISIDGEAGRRIKARIEQGPTDARIVTEVDTGWRPLPVLVAKLDAPTGGDDYVLLSGHIDSWYYGAMDNGSANAAMIEVARVLATHRDLLRRGLQVAFWSGHSHGRYATSAWYADAFWQELHDHCVAHVNIDSPGAVGATKLMPIGGMAETYPASRDLFQQIYGEALPYQRIGRGGDQSFWGVGIPSVGGDIFRQADVDERRKDLSGVFGWWWHTPDDTLDKLDPANLQRDACVLLASVYQYTTATVLPFRQSAAVDEIRAALDEIATAAGDAFDLSATRADADALRQATERLEVRAGQP
ncbi:MAG TPA: M28 family peptidase, partial [Nitrolancea sp.]|nr:M28 family peptidase [Nitrolancea sp.]